MQQRNLKRFEVQKDEYKFVKAKRVKKIEKKQISFRSRNHKVYTIAYNKIAVTNSDDKTLQDEHRIKAYHHKSNIAFIKYFYSKEISNTVEKLKSMYINFDDVTRKKLK